MTHADAVTALNHAGRWSTSSRTGQGQNCVEVTTALSGWVGVRDTKNRAAGLLAVNHRQWTTFLTAIRAGDLN